MQFITNFRLLRPISLAVTSTYSIIIGASAEEGGAGIKSIGGPPDGEIMDDATELVSGIDPSGFGAIVVAEDDPDDDEGTFPNVDTKTLIRVIRKTPKTERLLILSAEANPLRLCTL